MRTHRSAVGAVAVGVALTLSAMAEAKAQTDTTRRTTSEQRIPIQKQAGGRVTQREVAGEVRLAPESSRIDSLEMLAASYRTRIDSLERANASLTTRLDATDRQIAALRDSLNAVNSEVATLRTELSATTARLGVVADSLQQLNRRFILFRNRSLFGNSGFYIGLGTGPTYTGGALDELAYVEGMQVTVPIGWHKTGSMFGLRTELAWQNFDGRTIVGTFSNVDPNVYSATAMGTLNFGLNARKTHTFYLMGGAGVYHFRDFQNGTGLAAAFGGSLDSTDPDEGEEATVSETKWGFTVGAGLQFHILGATYLFVQSALHNVSADQVIAPATNKNLRWIPVVVGINLR